MSGDVGGLALLIAAIIGSGGIGAVLSAWVSARRGVASDERETRRDTLADRDSLLGTVLDRLAHVEERLEKAERRGRTLSDHVDALEHHIWQGIGPPPPARPEGA